MPPELIQLTWIAKQETLLINHFICVCSEATCYVEDDHFQSMKHKLPARTSKHTLKDKGT